MTKLCVGDIVKGSGDFVLACGSGLYADAIIVCLDPLVAVSRAGDMLWWSTITPDSFVVVGKASAYEAQHAFARWHNDQAEWAAEFCRLFGGHDEGLMLAWFANAIMAGYDEVTRRFRQPHETTVEPAVKDSLTTQPAPEPTLLEAAERTLEYLGGIERSHGHTEVEQALKAAVERAKGGG